ncbi:MAG: HlyD family efflux transporter periplasmic adaptor subunit [Bacteroidetes bacterium]|nr:HlyD family efflux transporter periplasmic adaptor subunit [Bacteroidota bacterium]
MWFRRISLVVAVLILAAGFGLNKFMAAQKEEPARKVIKSVPPAVRVLEVRNGTVQPEVPLTGRLRASQRVELYAEVSGRLLSGGKAFQEGAFFRQGEVLFRLDDTDQRLQLIAQRAAYQSLLIRLLADLKVDYPDLAPDWEGYVRVFDAKTPLRELPKVEQDKARNFLAVNNVFNQYYSITAAEAQLAKYTVYAPFSGVVVQGDVDQGSLIRAGAKIGEFLNPDRYELEASIAQGDLPYVKPGMEVTLREEGAAGQWKGVIDRISQSVDAGTQTIRIYIKVGGSGLREGLYLSGSIKGAPVDGAISLDRSLLRDDGTLWIIEAETLALRKPNVVYSYGKQVVASGLVDGERLVNQRLPGAHLGMVVRLTQDSL